MQIFTSYEPDLSTVRKHREKIASIFHFFLELKSLKLYNSSTGERIYNLRRSSYATNRRINIIPLQKLRLSSFQVIISATHAVLPLYIDKLVFKYFISLRSKHPFHILSSNSLDDTHKSSKDNNSALDLHDFLVKDLLPFILFLVEGFKFCMWLGFTVGSLKTHDLIYTFFSFYLFRSNREQIGNGATTVQYITVIAVTIKFCEWFSTTHIYSGEDSGVSENCTIPEACRSLRKHPKGLTYRNSNRKCPLCCDLRVGPTLLMTSGYVFCFSCISDHISKYQTCPITRKYVCNSLDDLRRLYEVHY